NPPYSVGQGSENEGNQNQRYPKLDESIRDTYAKFTSVTNKNSLYDSYIRAYKWASERISNKGIIGFVSNGGFIDSRSMDGLRKNWNDEFNYLYIFNLRGDQRTQGELSRKEGGKIFGSGSRASIAISILVKDGSNNHKVFYKDIGDYLSREEKLSKISNFQSIKGIDWKEIIPDKNNDWINQRDEKYQEFFSIDSGEMKVFNKRTSGVKTQRDAWSYNFSKQNLKENVKIFIENFNNEIDRLSNIPENKLNYINTNGSYLKWSRELKTVFKNKKKLEFTPANITPAMYRPFVKKHLYYAKDYVDYRRHYHEELGEDNLILCIQGRGSKKEFSALLTKDIPDLGMMDGGTKVFLKRINSTVDVLFDNSQENITDLFSKIIDLDKEDTF